ncbi:MAG: hypothetical protein LC808_23220, partial [Actinobacteria bacterium]|nr:hypothetical protein [Actinomycetota bacterium]
RPLRGAVRHDLIYRLALGVESERELAEVFGVAPSAIHQFRVKPENVRAIEERRVRIEDELAGLWSAKLANRIAELESDIDRCNEWLERQVSLAQFDRLLRRKQERLHEIALQLGQLAPLPINGGTTVRYEIVGVDMDALR